jgi:hypothetical protein
MTQPNIIGLDEWNFIKKTIGVNRERNLCDFPELAHRQSMYCDVIGHFGHIGLSPRLRVYSDIKNPNALPAMHPSIGIVNRGLKGCSKDANVLKAHLLFIDMDLEGQTKELFYALRVKNQDQEAWNLICPSILGSIQRLEQILGQKPYTINLSGSGIHVIYKLSPSIGWTPSGIEYLLNLPTNKRVDLEQKVLGQEIKSLETVWGENWSKIYDFLITQMNLSLDDFEGKWDNKTKNLARGTRDIGHYHEKGINRVVVKAIDQDDLMDKGYLSLAKDRVNELLQEIIEKKTRGNQLSIDKDAQMIKENKSEVIENLAVSVNNQTTVQAMKTSFLPMYNFKPNQRLSIFEVASNKEHRLTIGKLHQNITSNQFDFLKFVNTNGYIAAALDPIDFEPSRERDRRPDIGSCWIRVTNYHPHTPKKAVLKFGLRAGIHARTVNALGGTDKGIYPPSFEADYTNLETFIDCCLELLQFHSEYGFYNYNGIIVSVMPNRDGELEIKEFKSSKSGNDPLFVFLSTKAHWFKWDKKQKKENVPLNQSNVRAIYSNLCDKLPVIENFITLPMFHENGSIKLFSGYDMESKNYVVPSKRHLGLEKIKIDTNLSQDQLKLEINRSYNAIMKPFETFPIQDRLNLLGALLSLLHSPSINGNTPLIGINANQKGMGKSLLSQALVASIYGLKSSLMPYTVDEAKFEKSILAALKLRSKKPTPLIIDNVSKPLGGDFLNSILTSGVVEERILYEAESSVLNVKSPLIFTANNIQFSEDTDRRTYMLNLFSLVSPQKRRLPATTFCDTELIDHLCSESKNIIENLIKLQVYSQKIKLLPIVIDQKAGFSEWNKRIAYTCAMIGKVVGEKNYDIIKNSNHYIKDGGSADDSMLESWFEGIRCLVGVDTWFTSKQLYEIFNSPTTSELQDIGKNILADVIEQKADALKLGIILGKLKGKFSDDFVFKYRRVHGLRQYKLELINIVPKMETYDAEENFSDQLNVWTDEINVRIPKPWIISIKKANDCLFDFYLSKPEEDFSVVLNISSITSSLSGQNFDEVRSFLENWIIASSNDAFSVLHHPKIRYSTKFGKEADDPEIPIPKLG